MTDYCTSLHAERLEGVTKGSKVSFCLVESEVERGRVGKAAHRYELVGSQTEREEPGDSVHSSA